MDVVLHPAHIGAEAPCPGTAYDPETASYIPCPHPQHDPEPTPLQALLAENDELRAAAQRWRHVAAVFQEALRATLPEAEDPHR